MEERTNIVSTYSKENYFVRTSKYSGIKENELSSYIAKELLSRLDTYSIYLANLDKSLKELLVELLANENITITQIAKQAEILYNLHKNEPNFNELDSKSEQENLTSELLDTILLVNGLYDIGLDLMNFLKSEQLTKEEQTLVTILRETMETVLEFKVNTTINMYLRCDVSSFMNLYKNDLIDFDNFLTTEYNMYAIDYTQNKE